MADKIKSEIIRIDLSDASYKDSPAYIEPTYVNFFFGNNGAGKSTIARAIKSSAGVTYAPGRTAADYLPLVYDQDFIDANFHSYRNMKGVFTLNAKNPKYFVMENVSGIAGKRGKTILQQLIEEVEQIGYYVHIELLDAQDYGVPQRRKRYIVVGERKDIGNHYVYPAPTGIHRTVRDTIGVLPEPPQDGTDHPEIPLHRRDRLSERNLQRIRAIKEGQGRDNLPDDLLANCHKIDSSVIGFRSVYGRMAWDDVAPTITARFDSFTRGKFGHPTQDRSISLREGALLQTFPIDFEFVGNKVDVARQIGNAVPPVMAECIGKSIIESYKKAGGNNGI